MYFVLRKGKINLNKSAIKVDRRNLNYYDSFEQDQKYIYDILDFQKRKSIESNYDCA